MAFNSLPTAVTREKGKHLSSTKFNIYQVPTVYYIFTGCGRYNGCRGGVHVAPGPTVRLTSECTITTHSGAHLGSLSTFTRPATVDIMGCHLDAPLH